jgi:hypothetical protein
MFTGAERVEVRDLVIGGAEDDKSVADRVTVGDHQWCSRFSG